MLQNITHGQCTGNDSKFLDFVIVASVAFAERKQNARWQDSLMAPSSSGTALYQGTSLSLSGERLLHMTYSQYCDYS